MPITSHYKQMLYEPKDFFKIISSPNDGGNEPLSIGRGHLHNKMSEHGQSITSHYSQMLYVPKRKINNL